MKNYVFFDDCGTVHTLDYNLFDAVCIGQKKEILLICRNCGKAIVFGLEDWGTENGKKQYCHYSHDMQEDTIHGEELNKYHIILSKGHRLMMQSGHYATCRCGDVYLDLDRFKEKYKTTDLTIVAGVEKYRWANDEEKIPFRDVKEMNVNMNWFMRDCRDDELQDISGYLIDSFNWEGTPYHKDYHRN